MAENSQPEKPELIILRRVRGGSGGAEKAAARYERLFGKDWQVRLLSAGDTVNGHVLGGTGGPAWWRMLRYAHSVKKTLLAENNPSRQVHFSLERGVPGDIYRAGDGVHRRWLEHRGMGTLKRIANPLHRLAPALEKSSVEGARRIVANSEMVQAELEETYPGIAGKISVIHNSFEPERFHPPSQSKATLRERLDLAQARGKLILFCGSDWERKGLEQALGFLARAVRLVKEPAQQPHLAIVGNGDISRWRSRARKHGVAEHLTFTGTVEETAPYYQAADLLLLPTLYDPFANVCVEALACGTPVITTAWNGASEIVLPQQTGLILRSFNAAEMREAVAWWLRLRPEPEAIAQSVAHLTASNEATKYQKLFEQVLETKTRG